MIQATPANPCDDDACADCVNQSGLCQKHKRSVLPQLKEPHWYRLAHSGMYRELKDEKDHSPEGLRLIRRKDRARSKRLRSNRIDLLVSAA